MSGESDPIRLRHLSIRDFRSIDRLELDFPEGDEERAGALVLAGDNGCGKTSVLEAILLLLGRVDLLPADTASPRDLVRLGARTFRIEGRFTGSGRAAETFVEAEHIEGLLSGLSSPSAALPFGRAITRPVLSRTLVAMGWGGPLPEHYAVEFFSAHREPEGADGAVGQPSGGRSARDERRLHELARRLRNAAAHSGRQQVFEQIDRFVRPFLGDRWHLDVVFEHDAVGSELLVVARDGELPVGPRGPLNTMESLRAWATSGKSAPRVVPIDRLSSGQRSVLALCLPFVFGDRPIDLALIDEPEEHFQPSWQRSLLGALRRLSPQTQLIVATHSPQVLDSVASYERRALTADGDWRTAPVADAAE